MTSFAYPAKIITLAISDVPGDDFGVIASGPTYPDNTSNTDALDVLYKYNINCSENIYKILKSDNNETPKSNNKIFNKSKFKLIARPQKALIEAAKVANAKNINPLI